MKIFLLKIQRLHQRNWNELVEEFKAVRKSSEYLFDSFDA